MSKNDPAIEEIRDVRRKISERFQNDPQKVIEYYIRLQKKYEHRLIDLSEISDELAEQMTTG